MLTSRRTKRTWSLGSFASLKTSIASPVLALQCASHGFKPLNTCLTPSQASCTCHSEESLLSVSVRLTGPPAAAET